MRLKMSFGSTICDERKFILVPLLGDIFSHFSLNSKTAASGLGRQCKVIQLQSRSRLLASDQWQVYVYHCSVSHKLNWEEAYANPSTNWSAQLHRKEGEEENGWQDEDRDSSNSFAFPYVFVLDGSKAFAAVNLLFFSTNRSSYNSRCLKDQ